MNIPLPTDESYVRHFALRLANDKAVDINDERAVMRALVRYGADEGAVVSYCDRIVTGARMFRPDGKPSSDSGDIEVVSNERDVARAERDRLREEIVLVIKDAAALVAREAALRAGISTALDRMNRALAPNHTAIFALESAVSRADAIKDAGR